MSREETTPAEGEISSVSENNRAVKIHCSQTLFHTLQSVTSCGRITDGGNNFVEQNVHPPAPLLL